MFDQEGAFHDLYKRQQRPLQNLLETWQDEAGIDPTIWTATDPATGTAWNRAASASYLRATSVPNANETARLVSTMRWPCQCGVWGDNSIYRQFFLEFEMSLANVANMDNSLCFFGLTEDAGDDRADNDIVGFALNADILQTVTDAAGTETTTTTFGETMTNWNRFGIWVARASVRFLLNGAVIATHTTNLPAYPMWLNWFVDTEAGGAATINLGVIRAWQDDGIRYLTLP